MNKYNVKFFAPPQYILNLFATNKLCARRIKCEERAVQCELNFDDYLCMQKICEKAQLSYETITIKGAQHALKIAVKKIGAIVGILAVAIGFMIYNSGVFSVEISGNSAISREEIITEITKECGNIYGAFSTIDINSVEQAVLNIDGVSYVSADIVGTRLKINMVEEATKVEIYDTQNYTNIVSLYDGIITTLTVISGTGMVGVGSVVAEGDVLIAAYTLDAEGNEIPTSAEGTATGRVAFEKQITYTDECLVEVRTGESTTVTSINIFGLQSPTTSPYLTYETEINTTLCTAFLSYEISSITYYETAMIVSENNFINNQEVIIEQERAAFFDTLPDDLLYITDWYFVKRLDKMTLLSIYYEVETTMT
ncbi:MAG: sporulation protein YqfD [Bacillota bacterium]